MKDCKKIHPLLPLYIEGALSPREKAAVEKHISTCADAQLELKQLERLGKALKTMPEPKAPRDLHQKIMARVHGKPKPAATPIWFHASWGLAAAAGLAMIFFIQDSSWFEHKNTPIVLKPSAPASSNPPSAEVALKPRKDSLANQQMAFSAVKQAAPPAAERAQAAPQVDSAFVPMPTAAPTSEMVLAMVAPAPQASKKAKAMEQADVNFKSSLASGAPAAALGQMEGPNILKFEPVSQNAAQYQLNWQTDLVTQGQIFVLDAAGNTLQTQSETGQFTYDHQMTIDVSKANTDFLIKLLVNDLNGHQAVTISTIFKTQKQ